ALPVRAQDVLGQMRGALDATQEGVAPGAVDDQSAALGRALRRAEANARPLFLPPGRYEVAEIDLPPFAHLLGVPGQTRLVFRGGAFMLKARQAKHVRLEGISVDGGWLPLGESVRGLLDVDEVDDLVLEDCEFTASTAAGAVLRACAGRVENSKFRDARTIGLDLDQSRGMLVEGNIVADCGGTGILVQRDSESADDTIVRGNRVTAIRADSGGTGQYGNGINLDKANGVIVAGNRIDDCGFSAIRCYSSDNVQVSGNTATRSGEIAIYVEFAFEGAIVSGNLIDDAAVGISMPNFMEHGGRLAVCSGNLIRNISGVSRLPRGAPLTGAGIGAEADAAISGNVIENAPVGIGLGWGEYLRDIAATGNMIRGCRVGITVSVAEGAGPALIADNLISGAESGGILGMRWNEVATGDLARESAADYPHLAIEGNRVS
nr:TIGR03808 family TAT-translocated repetitive protein [Hyphomicrobiales bacterium]